MAMATPGSPKAVPPMVNSAINNRSSFFTIRVVTECSPAVNRRSGQRRSKQNVFVFKSATTTCYATLLGDSGLVGGELGAELRGDVGVEDGVVALVADVEDVAGAVDFGEYTVAIDKTTFLPVKAEYLDKNGKLFRRVEAVKVETVQGRPTVTESRVDDLLRGGHTVNFFSSIQYDTGLNEAIFTERFLRRPPREATK
jgi:hypothetical protein